MRQSISHVVGMLASLLILALGCGDVEHDGDPAQRAAAQGKRPASANPQEGELPPALPWSQPKEISVPDAETFHADAVRLESEGLKLLWKQGRTRDGIRLLEQAIELEPRLVLGPMQLALFYQYFSHDDSAAINVLNNAISGHPKQPELYFALGNAQAKAGRHQEAIVSFKKAGDLGFEGKASLAYNLGNSYVRLGRRAEAIRSYQQALASEPSHSRARSNLIRMYIETGEVDAALRWAGNSVSDMKKIALSLGQQGRHKQALQALDRALATEPNDAEAHFNRGVSLAELQRHNDAVAAYRRSAELNPEDPDPHFNCAVSLQELGRHKEALAAIDCAAALSPNSADLHFARGIILVNLKRYEEALGAFQRTLELEPAHPAAGRARAAILRELGRE